jgi:hypothetical protein
MKIAIAGTGYVGLSNAMLLGQHNEVVAVDIIPEKIELLTIICSPLVWGVWMTDSPGGHTIKVHWRYKMWVFRS